MDKALFPFFIAVVVLAAALASYPYISALITTQRQQQVLNITDRILDAMDAQNIYLLYGFNNVTDQIIKNQELIKHTQETINHNTITNLNMTLHNRAMLDDTNDKMSVITKILGFNNSTDIKAAMKILNLVHNDTDMIEMLKSRLK